MVVLLSLKDEEIAKAVKDGKVVILKADTPSKIMPSTGKVVVITIKRSET